VGLRSYNRSGPINPHVETYTLPEGVTYKGQSTLQVRADHGAFGLLVSPQFRLGSKVTLAVPLVFGGMGGGFYLFGEDRDTPDGRRVSEWENDLFGDADSGFGTFLEAGVEARYRTTIPYVSLGAGV
ncbi:MAG TPA: hypothetical protein DCE41_17810, partial [Cytophagales bacterium]|nr:hypothetical protein [Cytophagales bacterium]